MVNRFHRVDFRTVVFIEWCLDVQPIQLMG